MAKYAMRGEILVLSLLITLPARGAMGPRKRAPDAWWGKDKAKHLALSYIMVSFLRNEELFPRLEKREAFVLTITGGIVKELWDLGIRKKRFSYRDVVFDLLGAIIGSL